MHPPKEKITHNPLLNPLVMNNVFRLGDFAVGDLKQLRLVCKLWNDCSLKTWRSKAVLTLVESNKFLENETEWEMLIAHNDPEDNSEISDSMKMEKLRVKDATPFINGCGIFVGEFLSYLKQPGDPHRLISRPFCRVNLKNWEIYSVLSMVFPGYQTLLENQEVFQILGPHVKQLFMERCKYRLFNEKSVHQILFGFLKNLRNLTFINCDLWWFEDTILSFDGVDSQHGRRSRCIFRTCGNLEKVEFSGKGSILRSDYTEKELNDRFEEEPLQIFADFFETLKMRGEACDL